MIPLVLLAAIVGYDPAGQLILDPHGVSTPDGKTCQVWLSEKYVPTMSWTATDAVTGSQVAFVAMKSTRSSSLCLNAPSGHALLVSAPPAQTAPAD